MNERIKELMLSKGLHKHISGDCQRRIEVLADLIINECVEQGKIIQSQTIINGSEDYVAGREMGIEVFMNQIKRHFGVES